MFTTPGFTDEKIHLFLATGLVPGEHEREADEFLELVPTRLSRALSMVEQGEIQDAKTALALLYTAGFRLWVAPGLSCRFEISEQRTLGRPRSSSHFDLTRDVTPKGYQRSLRCDLSRCKVGTARALL